MKKVWMWLAKFCLKKAGCSRFDTDMISILDLHEDYD